MKTLKNAEKEEDFEENVEKLEEEYDEEYDEEEGDGKDAVNMNVEDIEKMYKLDKSGKVVNRENKVNFS